jgi:histidine decarboxylase
MKSEYIEYIHSYNMTIPCSRSALNTLILWWIVTTTPQEEFVKEANQMMANARYFYDELQKRHYPAWLNAHSNTVIFQAPSEELCERWTLSLQTCAKLGHLAHAIMMQHVDKKMIDEFLHDLDLERSKTAVKIVKLNYSN